jgi:acetolactate synthase-1/2/3 large subunit
MRAGRLPFVLTAHEGSAGFAADVMGRLTGRPGLAIATLGPGATNLATGVGCAFLDRSPMLALTCNIPTAQHGRRIQMAIDHHALFRPIAKASLALRSGRIGETLAEALAIALGEPRGPVHLDLPEDVAIAETNEPVPAIPDGAPVPPARDAAVAEAAKALAAARRPVAVIGASALRMRDHGHLLRMIERHRLPFATTTMAKGLVDDGHPLALGCIERARRQVQRAFLRTSDLIVGVGYDTIEVEYEAWVGGVPVLHLDIEPADTDGTVRVVHQAIGDLDATLARLAAAPPAANRWTEAEVRRHRDAFQASLRPHGARFSPHQAIDVVRATLPLGGVLAFDVGAHTHQIASQWRASAPGTFLITNGWSSMGFGLPAAIAAKLARPDFPVVCLIGDGCFQMTCGEVAVARRLGLALPVVVLDDGWLALIKVKQQRRNLALYGTGLGTETDAPPAHYFGVPAVAAKDPESLAAALRQALAASGPTVIEAKVDSSHYSETVYD